MDRVELDRKAFRAISKTRARFSLLIDRDRAIAWVSESIVGFLGFDAKTLPGRSVTDFIHADDRALFCEIHQFELQASDHPPKDTVAHSVHDLRFLSANNSWVALEGRVTNCFNDPEIGMLLVDVQALSPHRFAEDALEKSLRGAPLDEVLGVILRRLTAGRPDELAAAIVGPSNQLLAASENLPLVPDDAVPFDLWPVYDPSMGLAWSVPIQLPDQAEPAGTLHVWSSQDSPPPLYLDLSKQIARQAALAIDRHNVNRELNDAALCDALTGADNRRSLERRMLSMSVLDQTALVAYVDLDAFKQINDHFGHTIGDQVLKEVTIRLRGAMRGNDMVARVGGDEFVIVCALPGPSPQVLRERLELVLSAPMVIEGQMIRITGSIGVATGVPGSADIVGLADHNMFMAKRGR